VAKWRDGGDKDNTLTISDELPVSLLKVSFKYNFEIGSSESLNFHIALSKVKDLTVFSSETLQLIIKYKWDRLSKIFQFQSFIFLLYLIAIMFHAQSELSDESIIPLMIFLAYFVAMEIFTISVDYRGSYFSDAWNIMDFLFIALLGVYIFLFYTIEEKEDLLSWLAILNMVSWLRGLSQLRSF